MNRTEQKNYLQSQSAYHPFFRLPETPMTKNPRTNRGSAITTAQCPMLKIAKYITSLSPFAPLPRLSEQGRPRPSRKKQDVQSPKLGSTLPRTFGIACHCRGRSAYPASNSIRLATLPRQFLGPSSPKKTQKISIKRDPRCTTESNSTKRSSPFYHFHTRYGRNHSWGLRPMPYPKSGKT